MPCSGFRGEKPGSSLEDHVTHADIDTIFRRKLDSGGGGGNRKQKAGTGNAKAEHAQSRHVPASSDIGLSRRSSSHSGSAGLVALALCAAMLAFVGGLLLCRAGVRRSRGGGRTLRCRQRRDLFVVYADEDEAWVTGTSPRIQLQQINLDVWNVWNAALNGDILRFWTPRYFSHDVVRETY